MIRSAAALKTLGQVLDSLNRFTARLLDCAVDLSQAATQFDLDEDQRIREELARIDNDNDRLRDAIIAATPSGKTVYFGEYPFIWDYVPRPSNMVEWAKGCGDGEMFLEPDIATVEANLRNTWQEANLGANLVPDPGRLEHLKLTCLILKSLDMNGGQLCSLLKRGYDDDRLPLTPEELEGAIEKVDADRFLVQQHRARPRRWHDSEHLILGPSEPLPLRFVRLPTHQGSYSKVEIVEDCFTKRQYVKKYHLKTDSKRSLQKEKGIFQQLNHYHIVRFAKSFERPPDWGMLLWPVADGDLSDFIHDAYVEPGKYQRCDFLKVFGCLSLGLEHIHNKKIRHRDIKPDNILYLREGKEVRFLWVDFGVSYDFSQTNNSATNNDDIFTPRYAAPEYKSRPDETTKSNTKAAEHDLPSDIFSFGLVILEILSFLIGEEPRNSESSSPFHSCAPGKARFSKNIGGLKAWIATQVDKIETEKVNPDLKVPFKLAGKMINENLHDRPAIGDIVKAFSDENSSFFCEQCRPPKPRRPSMEGTAKLPDEPSRFRLPLTRHKSNKG